MQDWKLTVSRRHLVDALSVLAKVSQDSPLRYARDMVKLEACEESGLILRVIGERQRVKIQLPGVGRLAPIAIPARMTMKALQALDESTVELQNENDRIRINSIRLGVKMPVDEFPGEVRLEPTEFCESADLLEALRTVSPFMSDDSTHEYIYGAFVDFKEGVAVATDRYRLMLSRFSPTSGSAMTIPRSAVETVLACAKFYGNTIRVSSGKVGLELNVGAATIQTEPIAAKFPSYHDVIPREEDAKATLHVSRKAWQKALKIIKATTEHDAVRIRVNGTVTLAGVREDSGVSVDVECEAVGQAEVCYNKHFLDDALRLPGTGSIRFCVGDDASPGKIVPTDNGKAMYLVMPRRE